MERGPIDDRRVGRRLRQIREDRGPPPALDGAPRLRERVAHERGVDDEPSDALGEFFVAERYDHRNVRDDPFGIAFVRERARNEEPVANRAESRTASHVREPEVEREIAKAAHHGGRIHRLEDDARTLPRREPRDDEPAKERVARAETKRHRHRSASFLVVVERSELRARRTCERVTCLREDEAFAFASNELDLEVLFELLHLPAELALPHRVAPGSPRDAPRIGDEAERAQAFEGNAALFEDRSKHDYIVIYHAIAAMAEVVRAPHLRKMKVFFSEKMVAQSGSISPSAGKPIHVVRSWQALGIPLDVTEPDPVTIDELCLAHDRAFVTGVLEGRIENGFGNTREDVRRSLPYTTGAMLAAARWAIARKSAAAAPCSGFHHAKWNRADGFCTFNGLVVTAMVLRKEGARRVGILDFDEHYGDGTDAILRKLGIDFVVHVTAGAEYGRPEQAEGFLERIETWVESMSACDVILYQAGADPHIDDPFGGWLTTAQLRDRDARVFEAVAARKIPIAWNLAGGYQEPLRKVLDIHDNTAREHAAHH